MTGNWQLVTELQQIVTEGNPFRDSNRPSPAAATSSAIAEMLTAV
jgi:hypothetical protein